MGTTSPIRHRVGSESVTDGIRVTVEPKYLPDESEPHERRYVFGYRIRIVNETVKSKDWFPKQGKSPSEHLFNMIEQGEMVATIEDSKTGVTICHVEGVKVAEHSIRVTARGIVGENVSMVAKRRRDESDLV